MIPPRHVERVLEVTHQRGWSITHIFETHVHADHITGGPRLSKITGAPYFLHPYAAIHPIDVLPATIELEWLKDGMTFQLGGAILKVLHIPGHTLGSSAPCIATANPLNFRWSFGSGCTELCGNDGKRNTAMTNREVVT